MPRLRAFPTLLCAVAALYVAWIALRFGGADVTVHVAQYGAVLGAALGAAGCAIAAWRLTGRARTCWLLLAAGCAAWGLGETVWSYYELVEHIEVPFPSLADVGYLAMFPFVIAALGLWPGWSSPTGRLRMGIDGVIVALSLLLMSWVVVLQPIWLTPGGDAVGRVISLAYPVGDALVAALALGALVRTVGKRRPLSLIVLGLLAMVAADTAFAVMTQQGTLPEISAVSDGWLLAFILIGLGGWSAAASGARAPADPQPAEDLPSPTLVIQTVIYLPLLAAIATSAYQQFDTGRLEPVTALLTLVTVLATMVRQVLIIRENHELRRDLEDRVRARTVDLRHSEQRFRSMVSNSADTIAIADADGVLTYLSPSVVWSTEVDTDKLLGINLFDMWADERDRERLSAAFAEAVARPGESVIGEFEIARDGQQLRVETTFTSLLDDDAVCGVVLNARDVTQRWQLEQDLAQQAFHDSLTGLPNRALFRERLAYTLQRSRTPEPLAVMLIDLDGFKTINDTLGHSRGDLLLTAVAQRLSWAMRAGDTVARLGGDEFAVIVEGADRDTAVSVADRLTEALTVAFMIDAREVTVRASIGIAHSTGSETAEHLLRNADLAMYAAKADRATRHAEFQQGMHEAVEQRAQLEEDLRHALLHREFVLAYQPVIELATGRLRGVEALIRWHHPQRGLVSPLDFIPVAEDSGLIAEIGTWVLREACIQGAAWRSLLEDDVPFDVAINISGHQLAPQLAETVLDALTTAGMRAVDVILEMTESTLMKDSAANLEILHQLRGLGVKLAIDDFGTGYSSLSYLRQFPVDILKIDKSFIDGIHGDANESAVARAVLKLSQTMHLTTIAEGIENQQQYDVLVRLGCPLGQGFLMSRPVPAEQITSMIRELQLTSATR